MTTALFCLAAFLVVLSLVVAEEEEPESEERAMFPELYEASEEAELIIEQYLQEIGEESL